MVNTIIINLRYLLAETFIGWALSIMPDGEERLSLAEWIVNLSPSQ